MSPAERARRQRFRQFMDTYFWARWSDLQAMELATNGFPAEVAAYKAQRPPLTFKRYLISSRGCPR